MSAYTFTPIGKIHSCFKEKFGTPRQSGLVPSADAVLEIAPPFQNSEAFRELETFSHVWIVFVFHHCIKSQWRPTVRPPRLGGNRRVGVFASRSGFRPNPIGQSAVKLVNVETGKGMIRIHLQGVDMIDGTPVLDIKPYLPYADSLPEADGGYAPQRPNAKFSVRFTAVAEEACRAIRDTKHPKLMQLIVDLLAMDPRPGYANAAAKRQYGMRLWDLNIIFSVMDDCLMVENIEKI